MGRRCQRSRLTSATEARGPSGADGRAGLAGSERTGLQTDGDRGPTWREAITASLNTMDGTTRSRSLRLRLGVTY